jgi:RHS repeat-associated protein
MGYVTQTTYDAAARMTQTIEDYGTGLLNRTTNSTYTLDNLVSTLTAVNAATGNQTTTYTYGTTLSTSGVARNDLLASVAYPDSVSGSDVVSYTYNTLGQHATITDQRGTVRTLLYDKLGRLTDDCVTTLGSSTDNAVLRISSAYEVRGMAATITSYNNATPGSGAAVNQCALTYNTFAQLSEEQQDHGGTVSGSSPSVQYAYDSGASSSNEIRLSSLTYPNTRVVSYNFASGMDASLSRVTSISDTSATLASYTYLGLATVIRITYPQPSVWLDLWGATSGTLSGLDPFNRVIDQRWQNSITGTPSDIDRYQYGYDQNSNRLYKANVVGTPIVTGGLDEFYTYDHLNRLTQMQRGTLNSGKTGITGTPSREMDWTLDPTGNWPAYLTKTSGTTDLSQSRTSNKVNEITAVTESTGPTWVTPAYDAAGNTTTMPQVANPTQEFIAVYDAWNRVVRISDSSNVVAQYAYDGRSRRITKLTYSGGVLSETRDFYYTDAWQDIEERINGSTSMDKQYVWGTRYIDELVCRDDATPQRLYACQDANFNVTSIPDTSGTVQERLIYDPYGTSTVADGSWAATLDAYGWAHRFTGQQFDGGTQNYLYRSRNFSPQLGRFTSRDSMGYADGHNVYQYVMSRPTVLIDASGMSCTCAAAPPMPDPDCFPGAWVVTSDIAQCLEASCVGNCVKFTSWHCTMLPPNVFAPRRRGWENVISWGHNDCVDLNVPPIACNE